MSRNVVLSLVAVSVLVAGWLRVYGQSDPDSGTPIDLEDYECAYGVGCALASASCWGTGHEWGGTTCAVCVSGNPSANDFCQKADDDASCAHNGVMQFCGAKWNGTCVGAPVGTCVPVVQISARCAVPRCN